MIFFGLLAVVGVLAFALGARGWSLVFWSFFVLYVAGVGMWLIAGILPSIAHDGDGFHSWLHEQAGDELRADGMVTVHFANDILCTGDRGNCDFYNITLKSHDGRTLSSSPVLAAGARADYRFLAPPPGAYKIESAAHPDVESELRFSGRGADSIAIRVESPAHYHKVGASGLRGVALRVADASHQAVPELGVRVTLETLFSVVNLGLGVLLILRRPADRIVRLLAVGMIGTAATFNHQSHIVFNEALLGDWGDQHDLFHLGSGMAYMFAVLVFPDGHLVPRVSAVWARRLLPVAYGFASLLIAGWVLFGTTTSHPGQSFFTVLFGLAIPLVGVAAQTYRLRREVDPERRQQARLLRWALTPMLLAGVAYYILLRIADSSSSGYSNSGIEDVGLAIFPALFALIPIALVVGILRYRLWDIDVLISKTLLSVGLVAFIGAVYVVVVVLLGRAIGPSESTGVLRIAATAIAAVAFEPVRERLQRLANRLVYGERASPYEVMAGFPDKLAGVVSVDEVLPRTAEAVARGVGAVASRVTAFLPGGGERTVQWPVGGAHRAYSRVVAVSYRDEPVGEIAVAKATGERLTPADDALLNSLASQAGLAFNNARLTIELQARLQEISVQAADLSASRQRIVTARQVQRQRIVQLIHDRVETRLEAAGAQLEHVEQLLPDDPAAALDCFDGLMEHCGESLDALRDLARGIFPAVLSDQGVTPALNAYVLQAALPITIDLDGGHERVDANAEASVYFCVVQALENAGTYASGSHVSVRLSPSVDRLEFSVADDGPGVEPTRLAQGADIQHMRDRVEAVGGVLEARSALGRGTTVSGWVPAHALVG